MIASVVISAVLFAALIIGYALRHKHPESLSAIYYGMANGWMFPLTIGVCGGLIVAAMFEITPERFQFVVFLLMAGAMFVAASPKYRDGLDGPVHYTSAIIMCAALLAWVIAMGYFPYFGITGGIVGLFKRRYLVYAFEVGMLVNLFYVLIFELV